ncbi:MAG: AAA family ATPase [Lachnospiraceae bacterium]|nr:AAA family ATPase [Lachnospiraceae bacterium]
MRPMKLTMRAFGSYGNQTTIRFDGLNQNLFLITGDTGAGKTTIFDAIVFALYGETGSSANKKDGVVLQSQFMPFDQEPFVELTFSEENQKTRQQIGPDHFGENTNGAPTDAASGRMVWKETCGGAASGGITWNTVNENGASVYTVRRVPRHLRLLTRGAGKGSATREVPGSVALTMPDGTDYPSKETDRKLEEIVGLTKAQFMQVAMIAQGEFMELLRAKSDDKKIIFRKLFHTDLYQKIEEELANRKKEKEKEIGQIRTVCQIEAGHIRIPGVYEKRSEIDQLKKQIVNGEITVLEPFLEALDELCGYLAKEQEKAKAEYDEAKLRQNVKRDIFTGAQNLAKLYEQLEMAQKDLAECETQEEEIAKARTLAEQLRAAYEIRGEYQRYCDARSAAVASKGNLAKLQETLPAQENRLREAEQEQERQKQLLERQQAETARTEERVKRALEIFRKIAEADTEIQVRENARKAAQKEAADGQKRLEKLEAQEQAWRGEERELGDTPELLVSCTGHETTFARMAENLKEVKTLQKKEEAQEKKCAELKAQYQNANQAYREARAWYEENRGLFLDEQAGLLAQELKDGQPCPVCGSLEHPAPFKPIIRFADADIPPGDGSGLARDVTAENIYSGNRESVTQETLNELERDANEKGERQQELAAAAQSANERLKERQESLLRELSKLWQEVKAAVAAMADTQAFVYSDIAKQQKMSAMSQSDLPKLQETPALSGKCSSVEMSYCECSADILPEGQGCNLAGAERGAWENRPAIGGAAKTQQIIQWAGEQIAFWQQKLGEEKARLAERMSQLENVRRQLSGIDEKKKKLREAAEAAGAALAKAQADLEGSVKKRETLNESGAFHTEDEAKSALRAAKNAQKQQEALSNAASDSGKKAREERDHTLALIKKYTEELPEQEALCKERLEAYEACRKQRKLEEAQWQALAAEHIPEEETALREQIEQHTQRKVSAGSRMESAKEAIGDRSRPNPELLEKDLREAERITAETETRLADIREDAQADERTRKTLASQLGERRRIVEEHTRLDTLYRLISGNVTDSRMDLETFVQRYYMERILHAANRRFLEMSGGQFELRMVDAEKAGKGKNRGLDLMVYSAVTGKEREIRTLSGGESFMAALSLALGMADQIQQSTAAIHLDMMFIDEGFGSLDEHSREQAVRVLQEMAGGDRLIGIISHVTELKQEIDDQLIVTKDESGSHVRWQIS